MVDEINVKKIFSKARAPPTWSVFQIKIQFNGGGGVHVASWLAFGQ